MLKTYLILVTLVIAMLSYLAIKNKTKKKKRDMKRNMIVAAICVSAALVGTIMYI